ncbi:MAG: hypothetical protein FJ091_14065 [Deltaproteobacteria bacterium]|nr:hypothetical protein [Deltaproteobacteria bacterium]
MNAFRAALAAACLLGAAQAGAAPLLSEIFYDAVGADDGNSFIEIWGTPGSVLDGLTIEGINGTGGTVTHTLTLTGTIGASGLFVIADGLAGGTTNVANADLILDFDFQNGPDSVVLRSGATILDAVGYGVFTASDVFAGEGSPTVDPLAGSSIARVFANVDTNDNAADWIGGAPTPGSASLQPVSEPPLGALFGITGLALFARKRSMARAG